MHYHIVGIGGFGMSAIALVLLERGHRVSGSDMRANATTTTLAQAGAEIFIGHAAQQLGAAEMVLRSTAIPDHNPEIEAALAKAIPVYDRRQAMGILTEGFRTIAIAGTHGKTTTTALLAHVLTEAGRDPTVIVGGIMKSSGRNARVGQSDLFVVEADEYGEMFLGLNPEVAVLNNIEHDHPDRFPTLADLEKSFRAFVERIQPHGILIGGIDSPPVRAMLEARTWQGLPSMSFSLTDEDSVWFARDILPQADGTLTFSVYHENSVLDQVRLPLLGKHNVQNALAVCAVADHLGLSFADVKSALASFAGTERRSEVLGVVQGVYVVNDYAHHPTAVRTTLAAWRPLARHLWAVWEPHTYNRMRALVDDFVMAFDDSDSVLLLDVYSVREEKSPGLDAPNLAKKIRATGHSDARYTGDFEATARYLAEHVQAGDVVLIMSAGDAPIVGRQLLTLLGA